MTEDSRSFSGLQQCFSLAAAELSHKMAAHLSQAIRLPPSARVCMCVFVRCGDQVRSFAPSPPRSGGGGGGGEGGGCCAVAQFCCVQFFFFFFFFWCWRLMRCDFRVAHPPSARDIERRRNRGRGGVEEREREREREGEPRGGWG